MKASFRSLSKPVHALLSCTNSIKHAFPTLLHLDPSLHTGRQTVSLCLCWPSKPLPNTETPPAPTKPKTYSHLTNSAVFSVPTWTAFAFAVLTSAMFVAAWVTRPLVTPSAHPAVVTAAGARNTNAMTTTVRCTNLCGRQRNRKGQKKESGGKTERKKRRGWGGSGMEREDKAVMGQGDKGEKKDKSRIYCQGKAATLHYLVWWQLKRNSCTS